MNVIPMQSNTSFAEKMIVNEGGLVRYITATEKNRPCWCFLKLSSSHYQDYKRKLKQGKMDIRDFGEVLLCGWGESAPSLALRLMQKKYDVVC
jgi:hypothetical protein